MYKAGLICWGLIGLVILAMPVASQAQVAVGISIRVGPPPLPVYVQPPVPVPGYIWTPGYWAYGPDGYFWVPGTWVEPPAVGLLWTPGYWGWREGFYVWNAGYWGPHVGFYGGINYGCGYTGVGFVGGAWSGGVFSYNRSVTNVNTTIIHNTYNTTVINNNTTINRTSFNGGTGGVQAQPNAAERTAMNEHHVAATGSQAQHEQGARSNRALLASVNHGAPSVAATSKAGVYSGNGVVSARNASVNAGENRNGSFNAGGDRNRSVNAGDNRNGSFNAGGDRNRSVNAGGNRNGSNSAAMHNPSRNQGHDSESHGGNEKRDHH
jgi:hypothetical protein